MGAARHLLAVMFVGSMVGCNVLLGLDDLYPACEGADCRTCASVSDCGDALACMTWACEKHVCTAIAAPVDTPCDVGICDGATHCVECVEAADCGTSNACTTWLCEQNTCNRTLAPAGALAEQTKGDCIEIHCDNDGSEVIVPRDEDVPVGVCRTGVCANGTPEVVMAKEGTKCAESGGKACDGFGHCVPCVTDVDCGTDFWWRCDEATHTCFRCNDGAQNGTETDADCGGSNCPSKCGQGKSCKIDADCTTGYCRENVCCDTPCNSMCAACNLPGKVGTCALVPKYEEDTSASNGQSCLHVEGYACNGMLACEKMLGEACTANTECASFKCTDPDGDGQKTCLKTAGDPCTVNAECFNNLCTNGLCSP